MAQQRNRQQAGDDEENLENIVNRYDRQQLIEGWDQERLSSARVAVVGTNVLANYSAITLAALGFGNIEVFGPGFVTEEIAQNFSRDDNLPDYSSGFLYFGTAVGDPKAEVIAEMARRFNPLVDSYGIPIDLCRAGNINLIGKPDLIIDATNDPASKIAVIEYAAQKRLPVVSMSSDYAGAGLGFYDPRSRRGKKKLVENIVFAGYKGRPQGTTTSQTISALGVDEARKFLMPIQNEKVITDIVLYNLRSDSRFDAGQDRDIGGPADLSKKTMAMVGAGALGNFVGLDFVLNNIGHMYVIDFDTVESTNLNRQVWFYDSVGQNKAEALVDKLKLINPRVKFTYAKQMIVPESEPFFQKQRIDLMVDTVDNNKARALMNHFSTRYQIPFISGGTRYNSGQVVVSIPGTTACLDCQVDIDSMALNNYNPTASCIYAPQPSVITSNQIAAGLIGGEAKTVLTDSYGGPIHSILKYVSDEQFRLAALPTAQGCRCYRDKRKLRGWMKKMKHLYSG